MACMIQFAPAIAMATTPLARVDHFEDVSNWHIRQNVEHSPLRMNWVVVTEGNGSRKLQMQWKPSADTR
jgi:hypothetical protein